MAEVKDVNLVINYIIHKMNVNSTDIDSIWTNKLEVAIFIL